MGGKCIGKPFLEQARVGLENEFTRLKGVPGDFWKTQLEVNSLTLTEVLRAGGDVPTAEQVAKGKNRITGFLSSTTSTVVVTENKQVVKVLREPNVVGRAREKKGTVFSETAPSSLFVWGDPQPKDYNSTDWTEIGEGVWTSVDGGHYIDPSIGIEYQQACLQGELLAGSWYNLEENPYLGMVGVRNAGCDQIELVSLDQVSLVDKIWPALVMRLVSTEFNVGTIVYQWAQEQMTDFKGIKKWSQLTREDILRLARASVETYQQKAIPASKYLKSQFGDLDFFKRCFSKETIFLAAKMDRMIDLGSRSKPVKAVIKKAAQVASLALETAEAFLEQQPQYINEVKKRVVVGHADSKFSNTFIKADTLAEVVTMIKEGQMEFVILDAQSLAVRPGVMHQRDKQVDYAHWRIVPAEQQWAYGLMMLDAVGLGNSHLALVEEISRQSGLFTKGMNDLDKAWYWLQVVYKMVGVEPFVNAFKYNDNSDGLVQLTMKVFPEVGKGLLEEINRLADLGLQ